MGLGWASTSPHVVPPRARPDAAAAQPLRPKSSASGSGSIICKPPSRAERPLNECPPPRKKSWSLRPTRGHLVGPGPHATRSAGQDPGRAGDAASLDTDRVTSPAEPSGVPDRQPHRCSAPGRHARRAVSCCGSWAASRLGRGVRCRPARRSVGHAAHRRARHGPRGCRAAARAGDFKAGKEGVEANVVRLCRGRRSAVDVVAAAPCPPARRRRGRDAREHRGDAGAEAPRPSPRRTAVSAALSNGWSVSVGPGSGTSTSPRRTRSRRRPHPAQPRPTASP